MTTEKSAKEWFEMLKEPYRSQAIKASEEKARISRIETLYPTLADALAEDFDWTDTPRKRGWIVVYKSIQRGETTYLAEANDGEPTKEQLIEILKELVELKTLKDESGEYPESLVIHNYRERKDAAWKKAKYLLGKLPEPPKS